MAENKNNMAQWSRETIFKKYFSQKIDEAFFINAKMLSMDEIDKARRIILEIGENDNFEKAFKNTLKYYDKKYNDLESADTEEIIKLKWAIQTVLEYNNDEVSRKKMIEAMKKYSKYSVLIINDKENTRLGKIEESIKINNALKTIYIYGEGERFNKTLARIICAYSTFLGDENKFYVNPNKLNDELKYNILSKAQELYTLAQNKNQKLTFAEKVVSGLKSIQLKKENVKDYKADALELGLDKETIGKLVMNDGRIFIGEWKDGNLVKGKCIYPGIGEYKGPFTNLKKDGEGVFTSKNGDVYTGTWKNDFFDGIVTIKTKSGKTIVRKYDNGEILEEKEVKTNSNKRV